VTPWLERVRAALAPQGYDVQRELESGGMGTVFLARHRQLDRLVAIKIIRPELHTAQAAERFAAIRVEFRRRSADAQHLLVAAAVLADRVPAAHLGQATGFEDERLTAALDELEWHRWLAAEPRGYAFVARIVRDVIERDMVTPGQRQRLLAAAAAQGR